MLLMVYIYSMRNLTSKILNSSDGSTEVEISVANQKTVPEEEVSQHKSFMSECMGNSEMYANTEGLDKDRAYMACAISYDQKYKTAYAPCIPGAGCFY